MRNARSAALVALVCLLSQQPAEAKITKHSFKKAGLVVLSGATLPLRLSLFAATFTFETMAVGTAAVQRIMDDKLLDMFDDIDEAEKGEKDINTILERAEA